MIKDMSQEKKSKYNWVIFTIQHAKGKRKRTRNISCGRQRKDRSPTNKVHTGYSDTVTGGRFKVMREILG